MTHRNLPPLVPFLKRDPDGAPYLAGSKCKACGHVYVGERQVCAKCTTREKFEPVRLAETGDLYVYTIIHRSFPGIETPFVDAIVDLEDGAHLKGTLRGVACDPEKIPFDMPVRVVFHEVTPTNRPGEMFLSYAFEPDNRGDGHV
ncbi:Zn-ribbon domain-containing OB-fold protein [Hyphomonas sp.]|uniref:Zn-ribbon domain-containing OB-fold protein n=1 Tax=Hyphomonas sp. TaxID=87 RepID=UPI003F7043DA